MVYIGLKYVKFIDKNKLHIAMNVKILDNIKL